MAPILHIGNTHNENRHLGAKINWQGRWWENTLNALRVIIRLSAISFFGPLLVSLVGQFINIAFGADWAWPYNILLGLGVRWFIYTYSILLVSVVIVVYHELDEAFEYQSQQRYSR